MRPDEMLVGALALLLAALLVRRVIVARLTGEVPLYRTRLTRAEAGEAKFRTLLALNALGALALVVIGLDLLLGLGLKG